MRRWLLLVLLVGTLGTSQSAGAYSLIGGETLKVDEDVLRIGVGYPHAVTIAYFIPITSRFDLAPKFTFFYGSSDFHVPFIGDNIGLELRYAFIKKPNFSLALFGDINLWLAYHPGFFFGLGIITPGVLVSYKPNTTIQLTGGLLLPVTFYFVNPGANVFLAHIPIAFRLGVEVAINAKIQWYLKIDIGPDIIAVKGASTVRAYMIAHTGIGYKF